MFQVKTTKETPVGTHKSLFCQVTITQNGEPIVGTVGTTELQVNAPAAAAAAPAAADAARRRKPPRHRRSRSRAWSSFAPSVLQAETEEAMRRIQSDYISWRCVASLIGAALACRRVCTRERARRPRCDVYPSEVSLTTARDAQSIVVQAEYANGITRDVTDKVAWKLDREDSSSRTRRIDCCQRPTATRSSPSRSNRRASTCRSA